MESVGARTRRKTARDKFFDEKDDFGFIETKEKKSRQKKWIEETDSIIPKPKAKQPVEMEKRLRRFRSSAPQGTNDRISRALSQRMFLIESKVENELQRSYKVLGSSGNVYDVIIGKLPSCTCPDFLRGNLCKHVIFVLCRVLHQVSMSFPFMKSLTIELYNSSRAVVA